MKRSASPWRDLGDPRPKPVLSSYEPLEWSGARVALQRIGAHRSTALAVMLATRRSRRQFGAPATVEDLAALFDLCCRTQAIEPSLLGFDLEFRPHPSAGALQSVHCLVQRMPGDAWARYDARHHELVLLPESTCCAEATRRLADDLVPTSHASLLALVAEPGKAAAKYEDPESLIWRDAGVLLGYFSIAAEALGLAFCPLGITGEPVVGAALDEQGRLRGVGLALLGQLRLG